MPTVTGPPITKETITIKEKNNNYTAWIQLSLLANIKAFPIVADQII